MEEVGNLVSTRAKVAEAEYSAVMMKVKYLSAMVKEERIQTTTTRPHVRLLAVAETRKQTTDVAMNPPRGKQQTQREKNGKNTRRCWNHLIDWC